MLSFGSEPGIEIVRGVAVVEDSLLGNILRGIRGSASGLLKHGRMMRSGFFKAEVETAIRLAGFTILIGAFATTFAWGYHHRQQAQAWREQACAYRFAVVARRAKFLDGDAGPA